MYRKAIEQLITWKGKKKRKPLIIKGARQVGKTWLMKQFGKLHYDTVAYINFDNNSRMASVFEGDYNIDRLIMALEVEANTPIDKENTLIIFDEIQEVPKVISSLKYFYENAPDYHIISAGSLLGVAIFEGLSFPVGKVEFMNLYPMDFMEFLLANEKEQLVKLVNANEMSLIDNFSDTYIDLLKKYYFVGGMPEVVESFIETKDFSEARKIQIDILESYERDFSKHAPSVTVPKIRMVYSSIPSQLAKEHKKFVYGNMKKGARAREYETAIDWLKDSGLLYKVSRITKPGMPLSHYEDLKAFKLFMHDIGLMAAKSNLSHKAIYEGNTIFTEFKGALTEQYVYQQLLTCDINQIYYWSSENSSNEVDFVIQIEDLILPVEVKAEKNLNSKSLKAFMTKYNQEQAIRISMSAYKKQEHIANIPLYSISKSLIAD